MLHSTLEAIVSGVLCGAACAVLFLGAQLVLVGGPNQAFDWRQIPGALAWLMLPALIGGVFGAVVGLICGICAGLALVGPLASRASLRVFAAICAIAATVAAVRAPALVESRPGWATAEQRTAAVERLDQ